jgi:PIN domain nuclease of toxin-antitoxin system
MKLLLDTHTFLWWVTDDPRLSGAARTIMAEGNNDLFLSAASGWEIAIKARLGRLQLPSNLKEYIAKQMQSNAIAVLPIQLNHALHVCKLPDHHKDPFDRMLIAQSQLENLPLLTKDPVIAKYDVVIVW